MVAAKQEAEEEAPRLRQQAAAKREMEKTQREQAEQQRRAPEATRELLQREREQAARRRRAIQHIENLSDVDEAVTLFLIIIGGVAVAGALVGFGMLAEGGAALIASAVSLGLMLPLIAKLFRCLIAIHTLLLRITRAIEKPELSEE